MNTEIEVRFPEINKEEIISRLHGLGADDLQEYTLREIIFYDEFGKWHEGKFIRLRQTEEKIQLTFKHHTSQGKASNSIEKVIEEEVEVKDFETTKRLLESAGFVAKREQEKVRHSFKLDGVIIDIDTWPTIPTYLELEGESEERIRETAQLLELDWNDAYFPSAAALIETYGTSIRDLTKFTFDEIK